MTDLRAVADWLRALQDGLCAELSALDGASAFITDDWDRGTRPADVVSSGTTLAGSGRTRVLEGGALFEKAGVNFSHVTGDRLPAAASAQRPGLTDGPFEAMGVSLVLHPLNPYVPTTHMNVRCFGAGDVWWFGGGFDLTPFYGFDEDCHHWHSTARAACEPFGPEVHPRYKRWCDEYFFIRHRNEARGIGGLFFDDLDEWSFERCFEFIRSVGGHFLPAYAQIVERRRDMPYGEREREFQLHRRGRYVEFNLVLDRGTLFGLQSGGRTESILMSLPPVVKFGYDRHPEPGSPEAALLERYLVPRDWV